VALGVAVVVAIDLAGDAAAGSFRSSMQALTGKTDLEITATGGIDERYMATLAALPFDAHFAPLMEAQAVLPGIGAVPLYGADLTGAPEGAALSKALAARLRSNTLAGTLAGRPITFPIGKTIDAAGEFVVLDIADAQQALHRYGKLDRIDVTVGAREDFAQVEKAIRSVLPVRHGRKAGRAQRREPAHAACSLESARLSYISSWSAHFSSTTRFR
jgi:putative ABC transport system permease protein